MPLPLRFPFSFSFIMYRMNRLNAWYTRSSLDLIASQRLIRFFVSFFVSKFSHLKCALTETFFISHTQIHAYHVQCSSQCIYLTIPLSSVKYTATRQILKWKGTERNGMGWYGTMKALNAWKNAKEKWEQKKNSHILKAPAKECLSEKCWAEFECITYIFIKYGVENPFSEAV